MKREWILPLLLALLAYGGTCWAPFIFDDHHQIEANYYLQTATEPFSFYFKPVWYGIRGLQDSRYYRPTMIAEFWAVWHFLGHQAFWFHLVNMLLHALVTLLVCVLGQRLFNDRAMVLVAGLVFAVHPVHSEAVSWIACSGDLMAALFTLLAYIWCERPLPAAICLFFALTSKEVALTVVAIRVFELLMTDRRGDAINTALVSGAVFLVYLGLRLSLLLQFGGGVNQFFPRSYFFEIFVRYLGMLILPTSFDLHHGPEFLGDPSLERILLYAVPAVGFLALLGLFWKRQWTVPLLCCSWIAITLVPACNLFPVPLPLGERSAYLASVASCWLTGWLLTRKPNTILIGLLVILPLYSWQLSSRLPDWCDEVRLWGSSVARHPQNYEPLRGLAANLLLEGSYLKAENLYARLLAAVPDDPDNRVGLAESLMGQHRWNDALKLLAPLPPGEQLAICLFHLERYPEAVAVFSSRPTSPGRDLWLGLCYQKMGQPQAAQSILGGSADPRAKLLLQRL